MVKASSAVAALAPLPTPRAMAGLAVTATLGAEKAAAAALGRE